ncbi:ABC transporter substrate-binding protein [uncultured Ferrimonas sp.]|uniref:ABC transporter substrate-binding protein n=1 Tax=uncultured Ferrimonas sp. TaxID=432640 RepID=UPI00260902B1|nr:ABC transporter substrate-binding protein [uncultured Ferrimonas sp.]
MLFVVGCSEQQQYIDNGLVYCSEGDPETFNPQKTVSGTAIDATAKQLYNRLIQIDPETGELLPELAVDWQISADGRQYLFTLRQQVQFHRTDYFQPSRAFNADDVLFSFERWLKRSHPYHQIGGARYPFFQSIDLDHIGLKLVRVADDQVRFELQQPRPNFLAEIATDFAVILSQEYGLSQLAAGTPELLDAKPIGTGPFKLRNYVRNQYIRYDRHNQYWGPLARLDQLVFDITPSASSRVIKLIGGDCDVAALPQISELGTIQSYDDLALDVMPGLNVAYWAFNTNKAPFNDPKVRKALNLAVDKRRILKAVYHNTAVMAKGMLPPISWAYDPNLPAIEHDPAQAKRLLEQANVGPISIDIWAVPVGRIYNPDAMKSAELIQQDLARIGVSANIVSYDWGRFLQLLQLGEYDSVLIGWSADNLDPDNFFSPLLSCSALAYGSNRARWCDPKFDQLMAQARESRDPQQRQLLYSQLEYQLQQQTPLVPLAHASRILGRKRHWQGRMLHISGGIDFSTVGKEAL